MHAVDAVGRRAVGRDQPLQGHDLPADRDVGEGEINAHSRTQMALGEAKAKAKREFAELLDAMEYDLEDLRAYQQAHPEMNRPLYHVPEYDDLTGTGARFARHLAERMRGRGRQARPWQEDRRRRRARRRVGSGDSIVRKDPGPCWPRVFQFVTATHRG